MRFPWKVLGAAGVAGVAAVGTGVAVSRARKAPAEDLPPDELRARLHERLAQAAAERPDADATFDDV